MRPQRWSVGALVAVLVALGASSCGGGGPRTAPTSTTPTSAAQAVTVRASVSPDQGAAGTTLSFTVTVRGPGTLDGERVDFGDGATAGARATGVACGDTARADHVATFTHTYPRPGTFGFSDQVTVLAPPPSCAVGHVRAQLSVLVAIPLSDAALNGAFVSPSKNIGCYIDVSPPGALRCATFSPPQLVTMDASGSYTTCTGTGTQCNLGNPAMETPVLPYGSATAGGPFQCLSTEQGMVCTVAGHTGFRLSRAGVQPVT